MDKRTLGIILTIVTALFCGCPGVFLCVIGGLIAAGLGTYTTDVSGTTGTGQLPTGYGFGMLCLGIVFVATPIVIAILMLRKPKAASSVGVVDRYSGGAVSTPAEVGTVHPFPQTIPAAVMTSPLTPQPVPDKGLPSVWRSALTPALVLVALSAVGALIRERGYELVGTLVFGLPISFLIVFWPGCALFVWVGRKNKLLAILLLIALLLLPVACVIAALLFPSAR